VQVPRRFYKVVAWTTGGQVAVLAAAGFGLDQTPQLDLIGVQQEGGAPPLGPFRTFQVPVADVVALTRLDLGPLAAADRFSPAITPSWIRLASLDEIRLDP